MPAKHWSAQFSRFLSRIYALQSGILGVMYKLSFIWSYIPVQGLNMEKYVFQGY